MPRSCAASGVSRALGRPPNSIVPASGLYAPERILSRVDLPAPFSPSRPCASPGATSSDTSSRASTPGKRLVMCSMRRSRSLIGFLSSAATKLLYFIEAFGFVEVVLGDGDRYEQFDFRIGGFAGPQIAHEFVERLRTLQAGKLLDRGGEAAVANSGERLGQRVETDQCDFADEIARFDGFHRSQRHVVV